MRRSPFLRALVPMICASLALTSAAIAQDEEDMDEDVIILSPFVVSADADVGYRADQSVGGTKIVADLRTIPLPISVLSRELIEDLAPTSLEDALRFTTGITAEQPAAALFSPSLFIRGNETRYVYRDGFLRWRANEPFFIEQVEILKGPTAILYGQALPGGTVNYATKRPQFASGTRGQLGVGVDSYGMLRATMDANITANDKVALRLLGAVRQGGTFADHEDVDYRAWQAGVTILPFSTTMIDVTYEDIQNDVENPRVGGNVYWRGPDNRGSEFLSQDGRLGQGIGYHPLAGENDRGLNPWGHPDLGAYTYQDTESLTARIEQRLWTGLYLRGSYHSISTLNEGLNSPNNDTNPIAQQGGDRNNNFLINSIGQRVQGVAGDTVTVGGNAYVVGNSRFLDRNTTPGATPAGAWFEGRPMVAVYRVSPVAGDLRFVGNDFSAPGLWNPNVMAPTGLSEGYTRNEDEIYQIELAYELTVGPTVNRFVVGYDSREGKAFQPSPAIREVDGERWNIAQHGVGFNLETKQLQDIFGNPYEGGDDFISAIILDPDARVTQDEESGAFALYNGTFFDRLHVLLGFRQTEASSTSAQGTTEDFDNESPQYGALFEITEEIGIYASRSESFLLTNARFTSIPPGPENPDAYTPGAPFPPQQGTGLDIGLKFEFDDPRIAGSFGYFEITHDQIPIQDPDVVDQFGRAVSFPGGANETKGVELEVYYSLNNNLHLTAGITWLDAVYEKVDPRFAILEGQPLTQSAEWQWSIFGRYEFTEGALEGLTLGGGANYLGERIRHIHTPVEEWPNPARTVIDLFARYRQMLLGYDLEFGLNLNNVTDEFYDSHITRVFPGFNATANLTVHF